MVTVEFTPGNKAHFRVLPVILEHTFERFDTYYYRCCKTAQVPCFTS